MLTPVVVHTVHGSSIRGVLAESDDKGLVLRSAEYLPDNANHDAQRLKGEIWIERAAVDFVQVLKTPHPL